MALDCLQEHTPNRSARNGRPVETAGKATAGRFECTAAAQLHFWFLSAGQEEGVHFPHLLSASARWHETPAAPRNGGEKIQPRGGALRIDDHIDRHGQLAETEANRLSHAPLEAIASDRPAQSAAHRESHARSVPRSAPLLALRQVKKVILAANWRRPLRYTRSNRRASRAATGGGSGRMPARPTVWRATGWAPGPASRRSVTMTAQISYPVPAGVLTRDNRGSPRRACALWPAGATERPVHSWSSFGSGTRASWNVGAG